MKSLRILVALIIAVPMAAMAADIGENGLYISKDMTTYTAADVPALLNQITTESPDKNILFYIHGRSQTLEKEWNNVNAKDNKQDTPYLYAGAEGLLEILKMTLSHGAD